MPHVPRMLPVLISDPEMREKVSDTFTSQEFMDNLEGYFVDNIKVCSPSIRNRVLCSGMLLYLHHINFKIFFHPAKFDNFKDEKISDFKTVSVSQRKNLLD